VVLDLHLEVEAGELAQVPARVRLLLPEDGPDLEDARHVGADGCLLVELRRLREARGLLEVLGGEDGGAALGLAADQLWRLDLAEAPRVQRLAEELADGRAHAQHGRGRRGAQVDPPVVEALLGGHAAPGAVGGLGGDDLGLGAHRVVQLERQLRLRARDGEHALDRELGALDRRRVDARREQRALHVDDGLGGEAGEPLEECLGRLRVLLVLEVDRLHRVEDPLPQDEEARVALGAHARDPCAHPHALADLRAAGREHGVKLGIAPAVGRLRHHRLVIAVHGRAGGVGARARAGRRERHEVGRGRRRGGQGAEARRRRGPSDEPRENPARAAHRQPRQRRRRAPRRGEHDEGAPAATAHAACR
jgi:hypothetical protein